MFHKLTWLLFFMVLLYGAALTFEVGPRNLLIVWNVGQGQWLTLVENGTCVHIDSGGERSPLQKVLLYCQNARNVHLLSHFDWDHMSFLSQLSPLRHFCRYGMPTDPTHPKQKQRYERLPRCLSSPSSVSEIPFQIEFKGHANDYSRVFVIKKQFLVPGDSTVRAEKIWSQSLSGDVRWILLGHHGSQTSTGTGLLKKLPHLQFAIVSARKKRYGHPHPKVLKRLQLFGLYPLTTEAWGTLGFEM